MHHSPRTEPTSASALFFELVSDGFVDFVDIPNDGSFSFVDHDMNNPTAAVPREAAVLEQTLRQLWTVRAYECRASVVHLDQVSCLPPRQTHCFPTQGRGCGDMRVAPARQVLDAHLPAVWGTRGFHSNGSTRERRHRGSLGSEKSHDGICVTCACT